MNPGGIVPLRRTVALLATLLLAVGLVALLPQPAAFAADRAFAPRFTANDTGDIEIVGNTLMTCQTAVSGCTAARNAGPTTVADSSLNNNNFSMVYVDVDNDASTFNSSTSPLALPSTATVLFAGLYWGGEVGTSGAAFNARGTVKLKVPGAAGYSDVAATTIDDGSPVYQGFADVTAAVKAAGNGTYTVGNVQAQTGTDRLAGWSLVIAYKDPTQPARNLSIFDGIKSIGGGASGSITVSGFQTPPAGTVNSTLGIVTYEGDLGLVGDTAKLNGNTLSDAQHPATNFFDSRISRKGVLRAGNGPSYDNNLGFEQSTSDVGTYIPNGATSATIALSSTGDVYAPGVVTLATDLYAPRIDQTKSVVDVNGGAVEQGDVLRYTVAGTNSGSDGAVGFVLRDPLPADVAYVPGSIKVTQPGGTATARTDASGDDVAEYDAAANRVVARLGTGSSATAGGTVAPGGKYALTFDVKVNGPALPVADGAQVVNTATATFSGQSLGTPYSIDSSVTVTVKSPDLTIAKSHTGPLVQGSNVSYTLAVSNVGHAATQGTVNVSDLVPAGLTPVSATGTGWTCTVAANVTCTRSDALAAGASYPPITFVATVDDGAPAQVANTATVSGGGDASPGNNSAVDAAPTTAVTDLALTKQADVTTVAVGAPVHYTLKVTNNGPSRSTGSTVVDTIPAGLVYVSDDASCVADATSSSLTCAVGPLAAGASRSIQVTARAAVGTAGSTLANTARVSANENDPTPGNNTSSASIDVRPLDLAITSHIQGDPATLAVGSSYTWLLDVTSTGGSPAADTDVRFTVPPGVVIDVAALDPRCGLEAGVVVCHLGTVAPGAVPTISVPVTITAAAPAQVDTLATVSTAETETTLGNNAAPTSTPVVSSVDLATTLTPSQTSVSPGDDLTLTAVVTNNGPGTPANPTVTFVVPPGTTFVSADAGCTFDAASATVTCSLTPADLESGESVTRAIVVHVTDAADATIEASATASTTSPDTDPSNDTAAITVPVVKVAGLSITKTVDKPQAAPGDTVTYTLTAHNAGPAVARDVVVADALPAGVTYGSAAVTGGAGTCTHTGPAVSCDLADLPAGATAVVTITATVAPLSTTATGSHQLDVQKVEANLALPPGATGAATATCPTGYLATDGSVRLDHVDQGTGVFSDLDVISSAVTADGTGWNGTVRNGTSGQAQTKVEVVCLSTSTVPDGSGHQHPLVVSAPVSTSDTFTAGTWDADLACGPGQVAIAPSFTFTDGIGDVRTSQRSDNGTGSGWHFSVDVPEGAAATFSVRCVSTSLGVSAGHSHDLRLEQLGQTVTVAPGATVEVQLTCSDQAKGIVASYDVDPGLVSLGNDPRPKTRAFGFTNPTGQPLTARVGLLCLDVRTGDATAVETITNTAHVSTSTPDASTSDDTASATVRATAAQGPVVLTAASTVAVRKHAAVVKIHTDGRARHATAKLVALGKVNHSRVRRGTVLATTSGSLQRGTTALRLGTTKAAGDTLRRGKVRKARLVVVTGDGRRVARVVRLQR